MKTIYVKDVLEKAKKAVPVIAFLMMMFLAGRAVAGVAQEFRQTSSPLVLESENWGLGFGQEGQKPTGNASREELKKYDTYFCADGEEKVIYLTFDCGYENGNTELIFAALKEHNAPATFFVVGHFLESAPELVRRMAEDV